MAADSDWVEVSIPPCTAVDRGFIVRFLPSIVSHEVGAEWRTEELIGHTYLHSGPPEEQFAGFLALQALIP